MQPPLFLSVIHIMKRISLAIFLIVLYNLSLSAAYLENVPQEITQPNGTIIQCFATGDEYYNWLHDAENYTIIRNKNTGFFVYADLVNDELVPTNLIPGVHNPSDSGLRPKLNISSSKVAEMRRTKFHIPNLKGFNGTTTTGTLNNIVIFIRFSDQSEYTTQLSYYDNAFNGTNMVSMYEYFKEVSDDQLTINTSLFPETGGSTVVSYQDTHARSYYKTYDATTNTDGYQGDTERREREHTLLKNATEAVTATIEATGLDFDLDNDGNVDNVAYIIQGNTEGWAELLWPHMWALYSYDVRISGARVWNYNFQLSQAFGVSVLCHEMFHSLGAPDLYRYDDKDITPVGPWDIMSNNRTPPQHMGAYMKMRYGEWFSSIPEITTEGTYTLSSLSSNPFAAYKISSPNSSEFFVVEYRKAEGRFESSVVGNGLIIYRINASLNGNANGPPDEIYIYRPNGTNTENGSIYSAHYSSGTGRTEINDATTPSSFLMDGSPGGLNISNIGSAGTTISFDVSFTTLSFNPPRNLTATSGADYIDLNWDLPEDGGATLSALKIYRNGSLLDILYDPTATSFHDPGLSTGTYNYYMTAVYTGPDGESGLSNFASADIVEFLPDLIVQNLSISPQTANAGSVIEVSGVIKNQGIDTGAPTNAWVYLSVDSNFDANDTELGSFSVSSLEPSAQESFTSSSTLPEDLSTGTYFLLVFVDKENEIEEVHDDNNISFRSINIRAAYPDLQITHVASNPDQVVAGQNTSLVALISNIGNRASAQCELLVALSEDRSFDSNDLSIRTYNIPELAQGEDYSFNDAFSVPNDIAPGQYYLVFFSDGSETVQESNESNNEDYTDLEVLTQEDIRLTNLLLIPDYIKDGDLLNLSFTIDNLGIVTSPDFHISLILSETIDIHESDLVLGSVSIVSMAPGETRLINESVEIPVGTNEANYYLHAYADPAQLENDSNPENNQIYRQFSVYNEVDLIAQLSADKMEYKPGEIAGIVVLVTNQETGTAGESELKILLSDDTQADLNDEIIDSYIIGTLQSGQSEEIISSYTIPEESLPGSYYFIAVADASNLITEASEQNNQAVREFTVLDTSSDKSWSKANSWKLYPNPAHDWLTIFYEGLLKGEIDIIIRNYTGQTVFKQSLTLDNNKSCRINSNYWPDGFYFIQVSDGQNYWNTTLTVIH